MAPSPGDDESKPTTGLASVFKGLAGAAKLAKSTPIPIPSNILPSSSKSAGRLRGTTPVATEGLPPNYLEAFERLKDGTLNERVAAAHELRTAVADYPLNPVLDIWYAAKDLIDPTNSQSTRLAGWELLIDCIKYPSATDLERKEYFQTIAIPANPQDFNLQLTALSVLTNHGRKVSGFDYDLFPLLSTWLTDAFDTTKTARNVAKKNHPRLKGKTVTTAEERNFTELFGFITDAIKFNFKVADEGAAEDLVDALLNICMNASVQEDLQACIGVLETLVTFGAIPPSKFKNCVLVLGSIHCLVPQLQKAAWHVFGILCRSHEGHATVRLLLEVLTETPSEFDKKKDTIRHVRGAISIIQKLVAKSTEKRYPTVPYALLVDGLASVVKTTTSRKIHLDIIRLSNILLGTESGQLNKLLMDEEWMPLLSVVASCAGTGFVSSLAGEEVRDESRDTEIVIAKEMARLISRTECLLMDESVAWLHRHDCISFFTMIQRALPDSTAILVLDYYKTYRCCFPSDAQWETNLDLVMDAFFYNRERSTDVRLRALHLVTELYDMMDLIHGTAGSSVVPSLVKRLLEDVATEVDIVLLQDVVAFSVSVATTAETDLFHHIIDRLRDLLSNDRLRPPSNVPIHHSIESAFADQPRPQPRQTPSDVVTQGFVSMFMRAMNHDAAKASHLFDVLVSIVNANSNATDARLTAMKLLFRLRADWANRIFITSYTESSHLAHALHRTEASIAREASLLIRNSKSSIGSSNRSSRRMSIGQPGQSAERPYPVRTSSGPRVPSSKNRQLWKASDSGALPEPTSQTASPVLLTFADQPDMAVESVNGEETPSKPQAALQIGSWLDVVAQLLTEPCDWEIYSFVLVYLPAQLGNHGICNTAVSQIQQLRQIICDQIRTGGFHEPPASSGLRRADVAICLFHSLTMILSYHKYFQKAEEDEIVRAFVLGIGSWERSAKCCIHALTICCHELPTSISKALVTILQKMGQIITQPYVAMHILEFLACLSRLPSLYANFREDEYRIVFGISFRYLQYVREKKQSNRLGSIGDSAATLTALPGATAEAPAHPNASDDLPQYVYALAYHVILFWFLALKLPDRANHVGWIAKNLFTDVDGSQVSDEQAQITMDFMQRVAYADIGESTPDTLFQSSNVGRILKKQWLVGNSIVTIEQALATGWAQIIKRHPSGTFCYSVKENFHPPPPHQRSLDEDARESVVASSNNVLPSHLLTQLMSSLPQSNDITRPIPLPDDDAVDRAIRTFDLNSTVDGHKVGVIYIGENQREEREILANVSGSGDYVDFLNGLGTLTRLKDATFNTQGLDRRNDIDGEHTFCWRDRVTELIFHVTTQMPTNREHDPECTLKKRHIGNDFVNIIFNDSGFPFKFDTFPSEFNFVNIVITPESRASFVATRQRTPNEVQDLFYKVQVMSKPGFPEISPASEPKIVSLKALPAFVRLLALNASVFSLVWAHREGGEHVSSWRNRLKEINRLRDKYRPRNAPAPSPPGTALGHGAASLSAPNAQLEAARSGNAVRESFTSLRRSSVATFWSNNSEQSSSHRSSLLSTAPTDHTEIMTTTGIETLVDSVDFSKWA